LSLRGSLPYIGSLMSQTQSTESGQRVLVAVDFSTASRAALQQGSRVAKARGLPLEVLHVVSNQAVTQLAAARQADFHTQAEIAVEGARKAMQQWLPGTGVDAAATRVSISVEAPVEAILSAAENAALLVMGAVGGGGARAGSGSVGPKVVRKSGVPVLLVPAGGDDVALDRALAAIDLSAESEAVLRAAERFCAGGRDAVTALHVWHQPWEALGYMLPVIEGPEDLREAYIRAVRDEWRELAERIGWPEDHIILEEGTRPADVIARHAAERDAPLIVVGAHGRSNIRHFLLGSTAETVLKETAAALLVVRADAGESGGA
jgi:nucleotide-binding universal stress UspA family protein